jgi:hypothetical protein
VSLNLEQWFAAHLFQCIHIQFAPSIHMRGDKTNFKTIQYYATQLQAHGRNHGANPYHVAVANVTILGH